CHTDRFTSVMGPKGFSGGSPSRRQTNPGADSASALVWSRLAMKSAISGQSAGAFMVAILNWARWRALAVAAICWSAGPLGFREPIDQSMSWRCLLALCVRRTPPGLSEPLDLAIFPFDLLPFLQTAHPLRGGHVIAIGRCQQASGKKAGTH